MAKQADKETIPREGTKSLEQDSTCFEVNFIFKVLRCHGGELGLAGLQFRI